MALISLKHVSKVYPKGTRPALDDINLDIDRGDFVFLVGASGSGKTTLLSLLLREEEATDGEIRVAGNDLRRISNRQVPQYRRTIGFVFQDYKLLNNKTVWQNVAFALEVIGTRRSTIKSLVPKVLETVGLTGKEDNYPHELSGGEQQRVAIARAYVNHPQILLADEPTGNLDPTTSLGIMEVLDAINRTGTTIVMATHNEEIVNSMRKRVVELHNGKIVRDEEHGSYDSAAYFPDAEVTSRAHQALGAGASDGAAPTSVSGDDRFRPRGAVETEVTQAIAIEAGAVASGVMNGDEGIARLAQSVHSGRTGRYGEAFAPLETTLTWGKGLQLDDMERLAKAKDEAERAKYGRPEASGESGAASESAGATAGNPADGATDAVSAEPDGASAAGSGADSGASADAGNTDSRATGSVSGVPSGAADAPADGDAADRVSDRADDRIDDVDGIPAPPAPPVAVHADGDASDGATPDGAVREPADTTSAPSAGPDDRTSDDSRESGSEDAGSDDDLLAPPAPPAPPAGAASPRGRAADTNDNDEESDESKEDQR